MSNKGSDAPKPEGDGAKDAGKEAAAHGGSGGLGAWLPLIVTVLLMPALAYVTTTFVIVPKVLAAREPAEAEGEDGADAAKHEGKEPAAGGHGKDAKDAKDAKDHGAAKEPEAHGKEAKPAKDAHGKPSGKGKKQSFALTKLVVNVAGSAGSRYLMSSATLVGSSASFKETIEENKDQLLDLASGALSSKTISDLEKPGSRNQIRAELISLFNNALGAPVVQEIYFTEFAIQ